MSAAEVPAPVNEITQEKSVADIPTVPTSAAEVPTPVNEITQETSVANVPNLPTSSVADVPATLTDSTVPHESATELAVQLTDSVAQISQKEYQAAFGPQGERM